MNGILKFNREKRVGRKNSRLKEQLIQTQGDKTNPECPSAVKLKHGGNGGRRGKEVNEGMGVLTAGE